MEMKKTEKEMPGDCPENQSGFGRNERQSVIPHIS